MVGIFSRTDSSVNREGSGGGGGKKCEGEKHVTEKGVSEAASNLVSNNLCSPPKMASYMCTIYAH